MEKKFIAFVTLTSNIFWSWVLWALSMIFHLPTRWSLLLHSLHVIKFPQRARVNSENNEKLIWRVMLWNIMRIVEIGRIFLPFRFHFQAPKRDGEKRINVNKINETELWVYQENLPWNSLLSQFCFFSGFPNRSPAQLSSCLLIKHENKNSKLRSRGERITKKKSS